jgi:hypothetical protein
MRGLIRNAVPASARSGSVVDRYAPPKAAIDMTIRRRRR